jgi:hypothetical protein
MQTRRVTTEVVQIRHVERQIATSGRVIHVLHEMMSEREYLIPYGLQLIVKPY